jgi:hypothetical protein
MVVRTLEFLKFKILIILQRSTAHCLLLDKYRFYSPQRRKERKRSVFGRNRHVFFEGVSDDTVKRVAVDKGEAGCRYGGIKANGQGKRSLIFY